MPPVKSRPALSPLVAMAAGFALWASCFAMLYAGHAFGCAQGWQDSVLLRAGLIVLWLAHLAALALLARHHHRLWRASNRLPSFLAHIGFVLDLAAMVAVIWTGVPILFLRTCA